MSIYNAKIHPWINNLSTHLTNFKNELEDVFETVDKYVEDFQKGSSRARQKTQKEKNQKDVTTLQSIIEDDDPEPLKSAKPEPDRTSAKSDSSTTSNSSERRASKKRSKNEVEGILSPEQDKRQKRNASVKAQSIISKQVNVNLTQKLRRENSADKLDKNTKESKTRRNKDDDKENAKPNETVPLVQIKQEKLSIPEPMEMEPATLPVNVEIKQEVNNFETAMPPPSAPVPKPRKGVQKDKPNDSTDEEASSKPRATRTRKQNDMPPPPAPVPSARSTRASSRARHTDTSEDMPPPEPRPKRTRAKKKASLTPSNDAEKESTLSSQESVSAVSSPADKRPKRTRRNNKKAAEKIEPPKEPEEPPKQEEKETEPIKPEEVVPKQERISSPKMNSPILPVKTKKGKINPKPIEIEDSLRDNLVRNEASHVTVTDETVNKTEHQISEDKVDLALDETRVISKAPDMDRTMVLPNGVYNHAPETPKNIVAMNETVVVSACHDGTVVLDKPTIMDATVVIDKGTKEVLTADNSLLTDDESDYHTPPKSLIPVPQPTSAVKEKVQQFEELASRVTRTKTRAMAKKHEEQQTDTQTPPDKIIKPVLSAETLHKMNNLIFNGKPTVMSSSASKPRSIAVPLKSVAPASTSKLPSSSQRPTDGERGEDTRQKGEDPRQKKEALLEAKREVQRRKREEKMAAAALCRLAAERSRAAAASAALQERRERLAHAQDTKLARLKDAERKKLEYARKLAETEERRKAEEAARLQRLAEEQKRAELQRKKQLEEQLQMKKEEARMAREIEKRQKEYIEKQKLKRKEDKCRTPGPATPGGYATPGGCPAPACDPVYMQDGFQYLNSDEDEDPPPRPVPAWSTNKARMVFLSQQAVVSAVHIDRLFSVRVHSPDLAELFPNIDRARLKRTSSAVWRTPPRLPPLQE